MDTHERTIAVYLGALLLDGIIPADLKVIEQTMHSLERAAVHVTMAEGMLEHLTRLTKAQRWPDADSMFNAEGLMQTPQPPRPAQSAAPRKQADLDKTKLDITDARKTNDIDTDPDHSS